MNLVLTLALLISAPPDEGWSTLSTDHFRVLSLSRSRRLAERILPRLEPELDRICEALGVSPFGPITVVVAPDQRSFRSLQGGAVAPWASGTAHPEKSTIYLRPLTGMEVRHSTIQAVASHEIAHLVLHKKLGENRPPRWLDEGMAVFMGAEPLFSRAEHLVPIALTGRYIMFRLLEHDFPTDSSMATTAYAESGDFVRFLYLDKGREAFYRYLDLMAAGEDPDRAMKASFGKTLFDLENEWLKKVRKTYGFIPALSGGALLWFLISVLAIVAYLRKRSDSLARRERLEELDRLEYGGPPEEFEDDEDETPDPESYLH